MNHFVPIPSTVPMTNKLLSDDQGHRLGKGVKSVATALISGSVKKGRGQLAGLLRREQLYPVFQPIASLEEGAIFSHEALIRGPANTSLHAPDALLQAAAQENLNHEFENHCVSAALDLWGCLNRPGRLFVNISADALLALIRQCGCDSLLSLVGVMGVSPRMLVLEITEYERVADMDQLAIVVQRVRAAGVALALDDFGDGRSSLRLWSQIKPEYVKIDKYFTQNISQYADKIKTIQAIQQIAAIFDTALVAEGIEQAAQREHLAALGVELGQGYLFGRAVSADEFAVRWLAQPVRG